MGVEGGHGGGFSASGVGDELGVPAFEADSSVDLEAVVKEGEQDGGVAASEGVSGLVVVAPVYLLDEVEALWTIVSGGEELGWYVEVAEVLGQLSAGPGVGEETCVVSAAAVFGVESCLECGLEGA